MVEVTTVNLLYPWGRLSVSVVDELTNQSINT